ncbi:MAG: hypothetical protein V1915_03515 [Candidatus Bathyarchaeota archaeon]
MSNNHGCQGAEYQKKLFTEFSRLKRSLNISEELRLEWAPKKALSKSGKELSGEVIGSVVFIYDEYFEEAVKTLRHELLDYLISQAIEPYKEVTNNLIKIINDNAYQRKEKIVESLIRLIKNTEVTDHCLIEE